MIRNPLFVNLAAAILAGCVTSRPALIVGEDPAVAKLQSAAEEVHQSLQQLAELQQAATKKPTTYAVPQSGPLTLPVTLKWDGPPEPVLSLLADMIGYDFRAVGKPPLTSHIVGVEVRHRPAWSVLEDIGWQLGDRTTVVVNEPVREIQLVYEGQLP